MHGGRTFWTTAAEFTGHGHTSAATAAEDTDADSEENKEWGEGIAQGVGEEKTSKAGRSHVAFMEVPGDDVKEEGGGEWQGRREGIGGCNCLLGNACLNSCAYSIYL